MVELVGSLEWCAKQAFPGADIVPMLIFLQKGKCPPDHKVRLVQGIASLAELKRCAESDALLAARSSMVPFQDWAALSPSGDWCLDVADEDLPLLQKLNLCPSLGDGFVGMFLCGQGGEHPRVPAAFQGRRSGAGRSPFC